MTLFSPLRRALTPFRALPALLVLALALVALPGCDSNDDDDGLGDLAVRASTSADVSSFGVTISYYRESSASARSGSIDLNASGSGTLDLEDDVVGVEVSLSAGGGPNVTLQLLSDGEVIDEATGTGSLQVSAGNTDINIPF